MKEKRLLVIIVTYNAMKWVDRCLDSLYESTYPVDIYIIDNGSIDGTQDYIKSKFPEVVFVQNNKNEGFGAANNKGIIYGIDHGYKYLYLLNQDAWVDPNVFAEMVRISDTNTEYGVLSPLQMTGDGTQLDRNFHFNVMEKRCKSMLRDLESNSLNDLYSTEFVMAAHWFLRVDNLLKVGLFSPAFKHYGEDGNLVSRFKYWGYKIGVCPKIKAYHDRQYREDPPAKKLYLSYVRVLSDLNNPLGYNIFKTWCKFFFKVFTVKGACFKDRLLTIRDTLSIVKSSKSYRRIYKNENCMLILNCYTHE